MGSGANTILALAVATLVLWGSSALAAVGVLVVANPNTPPLDEDTLQKVYLGKVVEINGRPITPVNLARGNAVRKAFMQQIMTREDENFVNYWNTRRFTGQGTPPREFATIEQQLEFLRTTPGAVGYVDDTGNATEGLRMVLKRP